MWGGVFFFPWALWIACTPQSSRSHYVLAEKLWSDRKYQASVQEFEKAYAKDPQSLIGKEALYQAGLTQCLFLSQYEEAIAKFKLYIANHEPSERTWGAKLQIGEILFKTEQYRLAMAHYRSLLEDASHPEEAPKFLFFIGKSAFYLFDFELAISTYEKLIARFPDSSFAKKAEFEIAVTYYMQGERRTLARGGAEFLYQKAKKKYEQFIQKYPESTFLAEAQFGVASCLEALGHLEEAIAIYQNIQSLYPSRHVIESKIKRISRRMLEQKRSR